MEDTKIQKNVKIFQLHYLQLFNQIYYLTKYINLNYIFCPHNCLDLFLFYLPSFTFLRYENETKLSIQKEKKKRKENYISEYIQLRIQSASINVTISLPTIVSSRNVQRSIEEIYERIFLPRPVTVRKLKCPHSPRGKIILGPCHVPLLCMERGRPRGRR